MNFNCEHCNISFKRNCDLTRHSLTEKCKNNKIKYKNNNSLKEKVCILEKELLEYKNRELNYINKIEILENDIINYKNIQQELLTKDIQLNLLQEKYEDLRKIVENTSMKSYNSTNSKQEINTIFDIDINVNRKQLNKTKYKDVPEEIAKKDIHSLKLKDNYQLEYREEDGYINITNLCKAGGKEFKNWNKNDKTKRFLEVLSSAVLIRTAELIKVGTGSKSKNDTKNQTWAHPQVAINIAQWISPEFDVLVSKWVYEIMLTGKIDISNNKTTQELDIMNKENKLLKNRIKLLESKVLQKQPREKFQENKNVVYIVTTEYKEAQGHYKIGKAQDLQKRMSVYNTTDKHEVIYSTSCKTKKRMDLLEQIVHDRLENKRIEPNKEWFMSEEDAEDFIKIIEEFKKVVDY